MRSRLAAAALALLSACASPEAASKKQAWDMKKPAATPGVQPEVTERLALLESNCGAKNASACVELGRLHETGTGGVARNLRRAVDGYSRGCTIGSSEACRDLERLLEADDTTPPDLVPVEATLRAACDRGTSEGCVGLSTMYLQALHVPESPEQARKLLERACDANNAVACHRLGLILVAFPQDMDLDPGLRLLERGCALGYRLSCVKSADRVLRAGWDRNSSWYGGGSSQALERFRDACRRSEYAGCVAYAEAYLDGRGVTKDPAKGREILKASCDDGYARACEVLGSAVADLQGGKPEAQKLWRRACDLRSGDGCLRLAQAAHAPAQPADAAGVRLVQQACALHSPDGCVALAELYQRGAGVSRDPRRAAELTLKACRLGAETGCERTYLARALR